MFITICEHLWQIIFPLSSIFFLLYAAESSFKSSCRVLPQVFSSPLSLKSKAGKSSCTSVPQSIHLCARQIWKEAFSDSVKKRRRKTMLRAPNVNQGNDESPFLQIFQTEKVFVNFSAAKIWNLYFCWQCHCKNWVVKIENAPRRKIWIQRVTQDSFCSSLKKISFLEISSDIKD